MPNLLEMIGGLGIVPVVRLEQPAEGVLLARALLAGGLPCAEVTFRTQAAADAIRQMTAAVPEVVVGAGTVVSVDQARQALEAGAKFIVSPGFSQKVVVWCLQEGVPILPGVATPSDILQALDHGLTLLKFFPAEALGGIAMLKAIAAPFGGVRFVPTGGITAANLGAYLKLPAVIAVGGSWLVAPTLIAAGKFDEITRLTQEAVSAVRLARGGGA
jgi:2-dehydro-3-deoxyphosphogluconate aldolase/(4S)-4-hydroxy-2-oxoglutarate aldolase